MSEPLTTPPEPSRNSAPRLARRLAVGAAGFLLAASLTVLAVGDEPKGGATNQGRVGVLSTITVTSVTQNGMPANPAAINAAQEVTFKGTTDPEIVPPGVLYILMINKTEMGSPVDGAAAKANAPGKLKGLRREYTSLEPTTIPKLKHHPKAKTALKVKAPPGSDWEITLDAGYFQAGKKYELWLIRSDMLGSTTYEIETAP
jgi:hypothetical protein